MNLTADPNGSELLESWTVQITFLDYFATVEAENVDLKRSVSPLIEKGGSTLLAKSTFSKGLPECPSSTFSTRRSPNGRVGIVFFLMKSIQRWRAITFR